jgi:hypothetical protein
MVACAMRATCVGELSIGEEHFPIGIVTNMEGGGNEPVNEPSKRGGGQRYSSKSTEAEPHQRMSPVFMYGRSRESDFTRELKEIF